MTHNPRDEASEPLLNDADFLRLMEAEYKKASTPVDELEKQKVWAGIKRQLPAKKRGFPAGWLLVAVVLLGLFPLVKTLEKQDDLGIKGSGPELDVKLDVQVLTADGRPQSIEELQTGQTLVFKVSSATSSYLALALQIDRGIPKVQFQRQEPLAGHDQILADKGEAFVYQLDQPGQSLKFCLLAARDRDELQEQLGNLAQHWSQIGAGHCQTLVVP